MVCCIVNYQGFNTPSDFSQAGANKAWFRNRQKMVRNQRLSGQSVCNIFLLSSRLFPVSPVVLWGRVRTRFSGRINGWGLFPLLLNFCIFIIYPIEKIVRCLTFWSGPTILYPSLSVLDRQGNDGSGLSSFLVEGVSLRREGRTFAFGVLIRVRNSHVKSFFSLLLDPSPIGSLFLMWFGGPSIL